METNNSRSGFYQGALKQGTILGVIWSAMFILLFTGTTNIFALLISMAIYFGSPAIAAMLAIKHRRKEFNNTMTYMQAWGFTFYMYLAASLFNTLVLFLYFKFVDGGAFFQTIQQMLVQSMNTPGMPQVMQQQLAQTLELISNTSTNDFIWSILSGSISNTCILPLLIAIFVRKNPK